MLEIVDLPLLLLVVLFAALPRDLLALPRGLFIVLPRLILPGLILPGPLTMLLLKAGRYKNAI
jgi:hypothetical protein